MLGHLSGVWMGGDLRTDNNKKCLENIALRAQNIFTILGYNR